MPNLSLLIALRYLFARKSHNVINIISAISTAGMAVGTAALIIILSVYNGFDSIVRSSLDSLSPDLKISPAKGKHFIPDRDVFDWARGQDIVMSVSETLEENVYLTWEGKNAIVKAKGADSAYEENPPMASRMTEGKFSLHKGDLPTAVVSAPLAYQMGISPRFLGGIRLYFPSADRPFSVSSPETSLESVKVFPAGIYSPGADSGESKVIIIPISGMRKLLHLDNEVSAMEIRFTAGSTAAQRKKFSEALADRLGPGFRTADKYEQNAQLYKMMRYEKASVFLILIFITIIIAFNIFSSLSMLIIEKKEDIGTLFSMGADERLVKRIFVLEGWLISLLGMAAGVIAGIATVLLQQKFGFVKMPGSFSVSAYPVILKFQDIVLTAASVAAVGYIIALLPAVFRKH